MDKTIIGRSFPYFVVKIDSKHVGVFSEQYLKNSFVSKGSAVSNANSNDHSQTRNMVRSWRHGKVRLSKRPRRVLSSDENRHRLGFLENRDV